MPNPPEKIVPDYAPPTPSPRRPICSFAAASLLLPMLWLLITGMSNRHLLESRYLDAHLKFSSRGMFWIKFILFNTIPLVAIVLACWSRVRIRKNPRLSGIRITLVALALNIFLVCYITGTIFNHYKAWDPYFWDFAPVTSSPPRAPAR